MKTLAELKGIEVELRNKAECFWKIGNKFRYHRCIELLRRIKVVIKLRESGIFNEID